MSFRHYLRMTEAAKQTTTVVRVFHGSPEPHLKLLPDILYGSQDFGFSASYAIERSSLNNQGWVYTLDFRFKKIADHQAIDAVCQELGVDIWPSHAGVFTIHPELIKSMQARGYDGLCADDFGFRHDFEEMTVYACLQCG